MNDLDLEDLYYLLKRVDSLLRILSFSLEVPGHIPSVVLRRSVESIYGLLSDSIKPLDEKYNCYEN